MGFFKNKHVILAMFIAPILSIIAYFAVDYVVSEKPHSAKQGNSYRLLAGSNCRYKSGRCTLKNGDVIVTLEAKRVSTQQVDLLLNSELVLQNAVISTVVDAVESEPVTLQPDTSQKNALQTRLGVMSPEKSHLRLALKIANTIYYAETSAIFIDYETPFSQGNFSQ